MMNNTYPLLAIAVIAGVTALLRFLPFIIFNDKRKTPPIILWLGKMLPFAIMGMLVVYCLKNLSFIRYPYGIPEIIACGVIILLHLWKRNAILSIAGGTICYMILVQMVFV